MIVRKSQYLEIFNSNNYVTRLLRIYQNILQKRKKEEIMQEIMKLNDIPEFNREYHTKM
jgi:hypothetical protein